MAGSNVKTFILAAILTIGLFLTVYSLNLFIDSQRQKSVNTGMDDIIEEIEDIEASYYLIDYLEAQNASCDSMISQMNYLESNLWKFDEKIRRYKDSQEEFGGEDFYIKQKRRLNRREIIQLSLIGRMKRICNYNQTIILYFYGNCKNDKNCGEQGFVLSYINEKVDPYISILSFDGDRDVEVVKTLMKAYNVTGYPCMVIDGSTYCGMRNRDEVEKILCQKNPDLPICQAA
jgi:hypothetical protein